MPDKLNDKSTTADVVKAFHVEHETRNDERLEYAQAFMLAQASRQRANWRMALACGGVAVTILTSAVAFKGWADGVSNTIQQVTISGALRDKRLDAIEAQQARILQKIADDHDDLIRAIGKAARR